MPSPTHITLGHDQTHALVRRVWYQQEPKGGNGVERRLVVIEVAASPDPGRQGFSRPAGGCDCLPHGAMAWWTLGIERA